MSGCSFALPAVLRAAGRMRADTGPLCEAPAAAAGLTDAAQRRTDMSTRRAAAPGCGARSGGGRRRLPRESPLVTAEEEASARPLRGLRDSRTLSSSRCLAFSDGNVALLLSTTLN